MLITLSVSLLSGKAISLETEVGNSKQHGSKRVGVVGLGA